MEWLPFISLRSHTAIIASKDETISVLRETIDHLHETLSLEREARAATEEKVLGLIEKSMQPAAVPVGRVRASRPDEATQQPDTLDLSLVDPTDNEAILMIARREIPAGARTSASALMRSAERIRAQVVEAHEAKRRSSVVPGLIPSNVADMIAAAENAGAERAVSHG